MNSNIDELLLLRLLRRFRRQKRLNDVVDLYVGVVDEFLLEGQRAPDLVDVLRHQHVPEKLPVDVVAQQTSLDQTKKGLRDKDMDIERI
jgi:hypothetical protein